MKPCASTVNGTFHPSGPTCKFWNVWLFVLHVNRDRDETVWIPVVMGIDVHNMYLHVYSAAAMEEIKKSVVAIRMK